MTSNINKSTALAARAQSERKVVLRTRGHSQGPVTRLMSPSDLGGLLRPFVFLDHFDIQDASATDFGLHPHSGIATVTWVMDGKVSYEDTTSGRGVIQTGGLEWMQAGGGVWHGGGFADEPRIRGFQLWIALPPEVELEAAHSLYLEPHQIQREGPVAVLLGRYGEAKSKIRTTSPINYLSVMLMAGTHWQYQPPAQHTVGWFAISRGSLRTSDRFSAGDMVVLEESDAPIDFHAVTDVEFVLGSAAKHPHKLVLGYYSVHTSVVTLREGEARIQRLRAQLHAEGRRP